MLSSDETSLQKRNNRTDARPIKALSSRPDARFQLDEFFVAWKKRFHRW